jgi:hypothetical protein
MYEMEGASLVPRSRRADRSAGEAAEPATIVSARPRRAPVDSKLTCPEGAFPGDSPDWWTCHDRPTPDAHFRELPAPWWSLTPRFPSELVTVSGGVRDFYRR